MLQSMLVVCSMFYTWKVQGLTFWTQKLLKYKKKHVFIDAPIYASGL
jgi:hypothetical protein